MFLYYLKQEGKILTKEVFENLKEFFKFQIRTKIFIMVFIMPFFSYFINKISLEKNFQVLTNKQALIYITSFRGFCASILIYIMASLVLLVEIGGIIKISNGIYFGHKHFNFYKIILDTIKKMKHLISFGGILIILFFFIIIPFTGFGTSTMILNNLTIPGFIQEYIQENQIFIIAEIIIGSFLIYISIQWIFAFHLIVLENKKPLEAIRESKKMIKKNKLEFYSRSVIFNLGAILVTIILYFIWIISLYIISMKLIMMGFFGKVFVSFLYAIHALWGILASFILFPFEIHHITRLYYSLREEKERVILPQRINKKREIIDFFMGTKKRFLISMFIILVLYSGMGMAMLDEVASLKNQILITAHRGSYTQAPENTIKALKVAIENKADYAEIDVMRSKDGKVFLSHDYNFKRTAGVDKNAWDLNYEDIKKLDVGIRMGKKFKNEKMPLLEDAIEFSRGKIKLNIELKQNDDSKEIAREVVKIIKAENFSNSCIITSLDYKTLQEVKKLNPSLKVGYIIYFAKGNLQNLNVDFYSIEESLLNESIVKSAHKQNREVCVWTANDEERLKDLLAIGVDNIITDKPREFKEKLLKIQEESIYTRMLDYLYDY